MKKAIASALIAFAVSMFAVPRQISAQVPCLWDGNKPVVPQGHATCSTRRPGSTTAPSTPAAPTVDLTRAVRFEHVDARGDVAVYLPDGQQLRGARIVDAHIPIGARVVTGLDAELRLRLPSGIRLRVGPGSEITVDDLLREPSGNSLQTASINLVRGLLEWASAPGAIWDGHDRYRVRTPNVAVAVRGTEVEFFFDVDAGGYVKLRSGEVVLWPIDSDQEVILRPGQMVRFDRDFVMTGPMPID